MYILHSCVSEIVIVVVYFWYHFPDLSFELFPGYFGWFLLTRCIVLMALSLIRLRNWNWSLAVFSLYFHIRLLSRMCILRPISSNVCSLHDSKLDAKNPNCLSYVAG